MDIIIIICGLLTLAYVVLMILYSIGWYKQSFFVLPASFQSVTTISIIIPARNEANNIKACIDSILAQKYPRPLFEIIVIDDHSTDGTFDIVNSYAKENVHYLRLADHLQKNELITAYKKKALSIGIAQSKGALIITTDADCITPINWLQHIAALYERDKPVMIVAPVDFICNNTVVETFQSIDFMSMQGITAAAQALGLGNMSNGANLAFSKDAFNGVNGYEGIDHLASGDDYLLMMKLQKKYPGGIAYLKSKHVIVKTKPQPDWKGFFQQRIRWASKSGKYNDVALTLILLLVYLFNLSFLVLLVASIFKPFLLGIAALMLICKIIAELYYLAPVAAYFNKKRQLYIFPLLQPLHIAYIIIAGFLGFAGTYSWKGRSVK